MLRWDDILPPWPLKMIHILFMMRAVPTSFSALMVLTISVTYRLQLRLPP